MFKTAHFQISCASMACPPIKKVGCSKQSYNMIAIAHLS